MSATTQSSIETSRIPTVPACSGRAVIESRAMRKYWSSCMSASWLRGTAAFLIVGSLCDRPAVAAPLFVSLGGTESRAYGVSADGSTAIGEGRFGVGQEAFRWTEAGGMVGLGDLPGGTVVSVATGVSGDGSKVVGWGNPGSQHQAFVWTQDDGIMSLGDLPGGTVDSRAYAISSDATTIVGYGSVAPHAAGSHDFEAFRWTETAGMVGLGDLPGRTFGSFAYGVSADGSTIVGSSNGASGFEAFRWTESGGMIGLGDLPGGSFSSVAYGTSSDGSITVGNASSAFGLEAVRWSEATGMIGLGDLPGERFQSSAAAVSGDGSTIVGYGWGEAGQRAFLWDELHGMRALDDVLSSIGLDVSGWILPNAEGISADGSVIVARGVNPNGKVEAWLAVIPEPHTAFLVTTGVAMLAVLRRNGATSFTHPDA
jgi:probable HAF family extracellular repeat protein